MEKSVLKSRIVIFVFIIITFLLIILSMMQGDNYLISSKKPGLSVGTPAPGFSFPGLDGKMVSLSDYRGKIVFVNIWATWCRPCVEEMPSMEKLYKKMSGEKFEILAVSIDATGKKDVAHFMEKLKLTFLALLDPKSSIRSLYLTTGIPESFIINQNGIIVKKIIGPTDWATPEVYKYFRELIKRIPG